jgi:hypothetical protein
VLAENFLRFPVSSLHMVMRCFFGLFMLLEVKHE